jgi:hypothetical protein
MFEPFLKAALAPISSKHVLRWKAILKLHQRCDNNKSFQMGDNIVG